MLLDPTLFPRVDALLQSCRGRGIMLTTAESCTGGLIAACLTAVAGSSDVVDRGFVTYSNEAKSDLLGVPAPLIARDGAVSEAVARAMAEGAVERSRAQIAISVTGVAGPGGGSAEKPVGLVHFGLAWRGQTTWHDRRVFSGDRARVREATVRHALALLQQRLDEGATSLA